jgi:hypothetical protein
VVGLLPFSVCTERFLETTVSGEPHNKESTYSPVPLLEGASFEENEDLHSMWAALLAYSASPTAKTLCDLVSLPRYDSFRQTKR